MISVHPCRKKLFKAKNWIRGGWGYGNGDRESVREKKSKNKTNPDGREVTEQVHDSTA